MHSFTFPPDLQEDDTPRADVSADGPTQPQRFSPNALEQKFMHALNDLESMEMTLKQLTSVDRTRAVAMAQQETVSLAQMLKVGKKKNLVCEFNIG